jgi:hypothetical protein
MNIFKKSVINIWIWLYNEIVVSIKKLENYRTFKRELKAFLMNNAFYSANEYLFYWLHGAQKGDSELWLLHYIVIYIKVFNSIKTLFICINDVEF